MAKTVKKLYRSKDDSKLFGVCGGIAEYLEIDSTLVRAVFVLIDVLSGIIPGLVGYFILAIIMPVKGNGAKNG